MRRSLTLLIAPALVAGCTFLISFDEVPTDTELDASVDRYAPADDAGSPPDTGPPDTGPPAFPPPCDPAFPIDQVDCTGLQRPSCAKRTQFASYPAGRDRTNDLVICTGEPKATCVQHCPFGCAQMPDGFPDQCDDCNGRANGYYCGSLLRGWETATFDLAVECQNGVTVRGAICGANKCASTCPRPEGPLPSCCVP